ncbi:unnamed protein product [Phytomonas sp. Hart1]|nr:unnamed protein product [Phytomonas sp. Hart1]|eukprot:CCW68119.1 unnamed protein product [Phytomonas sp. isolate Hart1]
MSLNVEPHNKRIKSEAVPTPHADSSSVLPWVEKYRPQTLDEVQSQDSVISALRTCLCDGAMVPHFLFYGPPGTGKTTAILAVAHDLFGPDYISSRVRELNASDDRGISVVREKIKVFAQSAVGNVSRKTVQSDGKIYPVPPFKFIILDEADALLPDAQAALRRMMEDFSEVTRFCILCNYVSRIIDPIASRCAKFRFRPLIKETLYTRIRQVAAAEGITLSDFSLEALDRVSEGDMRTAIMYLQSAHKARGLDLSNEDFVSCSGTLPPEVFKPFIEALLQKDRDDIVHQTSGVVAQGFSATQVLAQLHRYLVSHECPLNSVQRGNIMLKLCEVEKRLSDGCNDYLQLLDIGNAICSV